MDLFYREYGENSAPILILHGILGSGRNWHSAARLLAQSNQVFTLDSRNHGRSPHSNDHHLLDLVGDVIEFQTKTDTAPAVIIGHSMGGLVACELAFRAPDAVKAFIAIDIAPKGYKGRVIEIIRAMKELQLEKMHTKADVDAALKPAIAEPMIRQFILTNLKTDGELAWRVNLPIIYDFMTEIRGYVPAATDGYEGPTLFIRGARSNYIQKDDEEAIFHHFPNAELRTIPEAGHWVHSDNLPELMRVITAFLRENEL